MCVLGLAGLTFMRAWRRRLLRLASLHALFSNEISSVNDDVSCSLPMNQRKYFLKGKQLLTLQTRTTLKEPRLAVIWSKSMKKGGK